MKNIKLVALAALQVLDPARLLQVPSDPADPRGFGVGPELMFGQVIGEKFDEPVLLIRFATQHTIWFRRGSRSLGYDFLSPVRGYLDRRPHPHP